MALITCPACGKQISDRAVSCPHCGEPIQGQEPMMEYQQQEPVQQYDESGNNNNRKFSHKLPHNRKPTSKIMLK